MNHTPAPLKIIFAGTPEFAAVALQALIDTAQPIVAVYTQPDRPAGRGRQLTPSPVKQLAQQHRIAVEQPPTLTSATAHTQLAGYHADVLIVAAYGLILPRAVLALPKYGCLNIHASLLPRWRGAAPIQRAILAGDDVTGITIMQMDEGLDTGAMLLKRELPIGQHETAGELHDRLARLGAQCLLETLTQLQHSQWVPQPQDQQQVCYAKKLAKTEATIDWTQSALQIDRAVRAFNPWPVAQTRLSDQVLRIWQATVQATTATATPGTIVHSDKHGIDVACGSGILRLLRCQLPGAKPLAVPELLNGHGALFAAGQRLQ
ncbi:MAG: methionyl-tRNA formyltransferase [Gammaproteobacteria bacterium]|nr:methionyl-tRNA formyltransferase [Gammaproteobacteria bacterium]